MILFSPTIQALIASGNAQAFYLLLIQNEDLSIYKASTTLFTEVTMSNGITYESDDYIVSVDPPKLDTVVDREQYKLTLADPNFLSGEDAENGLMGKFMECRFGFFNKSTGEIYTDLADTFMVYGGRVDGGAFSIDTNEIGDSTFTIAGSSPMAALEMRKGIYLSRDYIRNKNPKDSCCDQIHEGSGSLVLKWGRA